MGGLPDWWTESYPQVTSVAAATAYLDGLGGSLSREQQDGKWILSTGDQPLYEGDTPEELDSFILGFALSQLIAARHGPIGSAPIPPASAPGGVSADAAPAAEFGL
jgi:hypothetical protein